MKRLKLWTVCMLLIITCSMQGCSSNQDHGLDPDRPITIRLWNYYSGAQKISFDKLVEKFNETLGKEKGIIVESTAKGSISNIQSQLNDYLNRKANAEELPNIFSTYADTAQEMKEADMLVSIEDYLSKEELEEYVTSYMEEGRLYVDEDIKIFPVAKASEVLIINQTAWDEFVKATNTDVTKLRTWEGLTEVAQVYYETYGKAFFGRDALMNYLITGSNQLGSPLFQVDAKTKNAAFAADKQVIKKLWNHYYIPYVKGYFTKIGKFASDDIKTNDIIASVSSSAGATFFPKEIIVNGNETQAISYMVLPIPNFEGCKPFAVSQGAGMAIAKTDETQEYASILFLKWLSAPAQNIAFTAESSYLPVTKEATKVDVWKQAVEDEGIIMTDIVKDTIQVSMKQVNESTLSTQDNFNHSYAVRNYLQDAFMMIAAEDQTAVAEAIKQGSSREEALAPYLSDAHFETWYAQIQKDINQLLQDGSK